MFRAKILACLSVIVMVLGCVGLDVSHAQQAPASVQPSCETRLATWRENGQNFILQVLELEARNRELQQQMTKTVQERDAALEKLKEHEKAAMATKDGK